MQPATARFFGLEHPTDAIGLQLQDILAPEVKSLYGNYLEAVRRDGRAKGLMRIRTRSGKERILAYENTLKADEAGGP